MKKNNESYVTTSFFPPDIPSKCSSCGEESKHFSYKDLRFTPFGGRLRIVEKELGSRINEDGNLITKISYKDRGIFMACFPLCPSCSKNFKRVKKVKKSLGFLLLILFILALVSLVLFLREVNPRIPSISPAFFFATLFLVTFISIQKLSHDPVDWTIKNYSKDPTEPLFFEFY